MLVVNVPYAVFNDGGVAIAKFVILVYKVLLISLISFGVYFFDLRNVDSLPASCVLVKAPFVNSPPLILESLRFLLPSMIIWRTFIFSFLSISTSSIT